MSEKDDSNILQNDLFVSGGYGDKHILQKPIKN